MLKKIKLLGHLGKKFGKEYSFDVASTAEAIKALSHQVKGFKQYLQEGKGRGQKFKIVVGIEPMTSIEKQAHLQTDQDISIVPAIRGGSGTAQIIVGAALIAVGVFLPSPLSPYLIAAGAGLVIGGVASLFVKPPSIQNPTESERDNDRSYLFNGAVNTTQQGQPIPIGYGRMKIGSQVVSASLSTTQIAI